jgi:hypothetical protein
MVYNKAAKKISFQIPQIDLANINHLPTIIQVPVTVVVSSISVQPPESSPTYFLAANQPYKNMNNPQKKEQRMW